jgi:hypothetical protein
MKIMSSDLVMDGTSVSEALSLNTDSHFEGDRLHIHVINRLGGQFFLTASGQRVAVRLTNSVIEDSYLALSLSDTISPGSTLFLGFNTLSFPTKTSVGDPAGLNCNNGAPTAKRTLLIEDNVIFGQGTNDTFFPDTVGCNLVNNIIFPESAPVPGNTVADPQFVSMTPRDLHLKPTSPAVNAANPSAGNDTDHDFDGVARPQGPKKDIGAFELKP